MLPREQPHPPILRVLVLLGVYLRARHLVVRVCNSRVVVAVTVAVVAVVIGRTTGATWKPKQPTWRSEVGSIFLTPVGSEDRTVVPWCNDMHQGSPGVTRGQQHLPELETELVVEAE